VATEIATLECEAAALRASAAALEAAQREQRALENERHFRRFDAAGRGALDAAGLQLCMREVKGLEVDGDTASRLLALFDKNGSGALEVQEFDADALEAGLEQLQADDRAREDAARAAEAEQQAKLEAARQMEEYRQSLPGENQDEGAVTRVLSALAYTLPLLDSVKYGLPLMFLLPSSAPIFVILLLPVWILNTIPFGAILLFFGMQAIADNEGVPALLRFNLRQAVQLDLVAIFPGLIWQFCHEQIIDTAGPVVGSMVFLPGILLFLLLIACVAYSASSSLQGRAPRGIPGISAAAERAMGHLPPGLGGGSSPPA